MKYWAGPWQWIEQPAIGFAYTAPAGCVALVDLRTIPQQSAPDHNNGVGSGFFASPDDVSLPSEYTLLATGDLREINTNQTIRSAWQSIYGVLPQGDKLVDYLAYTLTDGSDPDGLTAPKPLDTSPDLGEINLASHSIVWSQSIDAKNGNSRWAQRLRDRIKKDLQRLADADGDEIWRKNLASIKWKYARQRWDDATGEAIWLTPQMRQRGKGRNGKSWANPHATTYTETWPTNGAVTSSQDLTWTFFEGSNLTVSSGKLQNNGGAAAHAKIRMGTALSASDMYSEVTFAGEDAGAANDGPWTVVRKDSNDATVTCYGGFWYPKSGPVLYLYKQIAGSYTSLGSSSQTRSTNDVMKCDVVGSTPSVYKNGVSTTSTTDTAISGNTYAGAGGYGLATDSCYMDPWVCADIGGASGHPAMRRFGLCGGFGRPRSGNDYARFF